MIFTRFLKCLQPLSRLNANEVEPYWLRDDLLLQLTAAVVVVVVGAGCCSGGTEVDRRTCAHGDVDEEERS